ncbi:hypothetical protein L0Y65_05755 [Candidatus Micrarchaeota archaeon]|nr:hypothetical protein [Candidatus Micrarchaeota archaeon]
MIILEAFLGLGVPEIVVIIIAIVLILEPKNIVYLKPIFKAVYKAWLAYNREVDNARMEMNGVKKTIMEPIEAAKREVECETTSIKGSGMGNTLKSGTDTASQAIRDVKDMVAGEIKAAEKEAREEQADSVPARKKRGKVSG